MNLRSVLMISVAGSLIACGGSDKSSSQKQLSLDTLQKNQPQVNIALDSMTPAGIWVGDFSNTAEFTFHSASGSHVDNGRMVFLIEPTDDASQYVVNLCAYNTEAMTKDIFSVSGSSLGLEIDESYPEEDEVWRWTINFAMEQNLSATMTGDYFDEYGGYSRTETFLMAATKISDATSFTEAASSLDISYHSSSSDDTAFSDVSDKLTCLVSSERPVKGTATTGENYSGTFAFAGAVLGLYEYIDILEYRIEGVDDLDAGEVAYIVGSEARASLCYDEPCAAVTDASVAITESSAAAFSFEGSASLDDGLPDVEFSFSITIP